MSPRRRLRPCEIALVETAEHELLQALRMAAMALKVASETFKSNALATYAAEAGAAVQKWERRP